MTLDAPIGRVRLAVRDAVRDYLLTDANVTAVDFGLPEHGAEIAEDERAVRVHVHQKLAPSVLEATGGLPVPRRIRGFRTDVLEGTYRPHLWWGVTTVRLAADPRLERADPLRGGISISDERHHSAGTLGARVIDRATGAEMILSNWHVLVADWTGRPGQRIYQPGRLDGGAPGDTIARLTRDVMSSNLDAAVATLSGSRRLLNDQLGLGPIAGVDRASLGVGVTKSGRTTGVTHGRVTGLEGVAQITYAGVSRLIRNVVTISPFWGQEVSRPGDSGSMWLARETKRAIGLHFAGSDVPERGLALDIQSVLAALKVDLETGRAAEPDMPPQSIADLMLTGVRALAAHS
jgi:endonuclease G